MPSLLGTLALVALLQGSAAPPAIPPETSPEEEIRVDESIEVELRQLYVTVTSPGGPVRDLKAEDFEILDNGVPQPVVTFARGDIALAVVLLVDASASMEGERLKTAVAGTRAFVSRLQPDDEVSVMLFSDELLSSTPFGHDPATLLTPLEGIAARGGTAIHLLAGPGRARRTDPPAGDHRRRERRPHRRDPFRGAGGSGLPEDPARPARAVHPRLHPLDRPR